LFGTAFFPNAAVVKEVVVPGDYASDVTRIRLSPASLYTLHHAIDYMMTATEEEREKMIMVCGVTDHPEEGMFVETAAKLRTEILSETNISFAFTEITNTIDEAEGVLSLLVESGVNPEKITIITDYWHQWRVKMVWAHYFPTTKIVIHAVNCPWTSKQAQKLQQNPITWALANFAGLIMMVVRGIEAMRHYKQPAS
jgi:hypothetical protein